jgi:transposase-like protein
MEDTKNPTCRKNDYQKVTFEHKLFIIDQINNGQISANFASKKYNISRATIHYWMKKLSNYSGQKTGISKDDEIRKLKEKIEDLECVKEFQQDLIIEFEKVTGEELSKKFLPDWLTNEIQRKKKKLSK